MPPNSPETHVYRVGGPLRRNTGWLVIGPFAALMVVAGLASKGNDRAGGFIMALFLLPFGAGIHWLIGRARLEISSWGVRLRQTGYMLETPWENVERLRTDRAHEGFVTKAPMKSKGAELLSSMRNTSFGMGRMKLYDEAARKLLYEQRYIPIEAFGWHVRRERMRADLQRWASQVPLADEPPSAPEARPPKTPEERRKEIYGLVFIFGLTAAALAVSFIIPSNWAGRAGIAGLGLLTAAFAFQAAYSARISWRSGRKFVAVLFALFALLMALWSFERWHAMADWQPPKPHVQKHAPKAR